MKKENILENKFVPYPLIEPIENYRDNHFTEDFFQSNHFSYAANRPKDSLKYFHTTETIVIDDTLKYILKVCDAFIQNDSLVLKLAALPDSINEPYQLTLLKQGNQYTSALALTYGIPDSNWLKPVFTTLAQGILFDKEKYYKGDSLMGKISLIISALHTAFETNYTDTIKIYGLIKTIVQ